MWPAEPSTQGWEGAQDAAHQGSDPCDARTTCTLRGSLQICSRALTWSLWVEGAGHLQRMRELGGDPLHRGQLGVHLPGEERAIGGGKQGAGVAGAEQSPHARANPSSRTASEEADLPPPSCLP